MAQEILPPEDEPEPERFEIDPEDLPPTLAFTPVPRKKLRSNGLTPMRQRAFIAYLSVNGSVEMSATAIGASDTALYSLKRAEGAESFAAAWDTAIEMGARRVLDTLMDHAIHGTPEKLLKDGKVILERRKFNTRSMMWIVQQRFPELYGGNLNLSARPASSLPHGLQKLKEEWRKEWEEEAAQNAADREAQEAAEQNSTAATIERILKKYAAKVREEHHFRMAGNAIAADFALRQLAQLEVVLDVGGASLEIIRDHFHQARHGGPWSTYISRAMEAVRHEAWEKESADALALGEAGSSALASAEEENDTPKPYTRPALPFYLTEADLEADQAARTAATKPANQNWRQRLAQEQEWREGRRTESEDPGEGETYLPEG
ncbi:hypothetical protein DXH95_05950 [Sphingorhabdus pulchriflava]|uniref:Uncharacterized protein n=1 Tax=Sphingorhabdus pulchriflava TaxID=2292257 RepID=A0A371BH68_9SPHN|nr:hypothetical protein [Sphingorhabdus pulchriflava]RDV06935.1 hypothetical protein DXH95_05950 [Sphingorhabdus pulchriflava]